MSEQKMCKTCLASKPRTAFYGDPNAKDGLRSSCRKCRGLYVKERRGAMKAEGKSWNTRTRTAWRAMLTRCMNPSVNVYHNYGGRGIRVCDRWLTFENFLADMGPTPAGLTLDRIDNDGDYEPSNCRWATMKQQQRNRRDNVKVTHQGETLCLSEWAERLHMKRGTLNARLGKGWPVERVLSTQLHRRV